MALSQQSIRCCNLCIEHNNVRSECVRNAGNVNNYVQKLSSRNSIVSLKMESVAIRHMF